MNKEIPSPNGFEQPDTFQQESIPSRETESGKEWKIRPNLEAFKKKRDEFLLEAIQKVRKSMGKEEFEKGDPKFIAAHVINTLAAMFRINTDSVINNPPFIKEIGAQDPYHKRESDRTVELFDTYPEGYIEEFIENYREK